MVASNTTPDYLDNSSEDEILYDTPIVRIGLTENKESIEFRSSGKFSVYNNEGIVFLKNVTSQYKWRIKIEQSYRAKYSYNILLGKFIDRTAAQELSYNLIEKGLGARIKTLGDRHYYKNKLINDNSQYWVIVDGFFSEVQAKSFAYEILSHYRYKIVKEKLKEPGAILEIFDSEYEKLGEAENVIRIVPESKDVVFYIYDLIIDDKYQIKHNNCRIFRGSLEFRSNDAGKLVIISETPLEKYIESVMALEMKSDFPYEALKAQAITVRSKTLAGLRIRHYNDPYDICASSHCQVFTGLTRHVENIGNAVKDTKGKVLINDNKIFDANYDLICGGCTEKSIILDAEIINTLDTNVFDDLKNEHEKIYGDLSNDKNVYQWINSEPDVFCNLSGNFDLNYLQRHFRWEINYSRKELEEIISENVGKIIGTLYDIIPIKRGFSGRLIEVEIIASNKNLIIQEEINIRKTLARNMLHSSCFYVDKEIDEDGIPFSFTIRGAGLGNGVGLCQTGAIVMAQEGFNNKQILKHYFKGTKIKKVY